MLFPSAITFVIAISIVYLVLVLLVGRQLTFNDLVSMKKNDPIIPPANYDVQDIHFSGPTGVKLSGWFIRANGNPTGKTLVLLHGWMSTRMKVIPQAKMFVDNGFHVVVFDQRSHGYSGKALITYGPEEASDFLACIDFLATLRDVNCSQVGVIAFSLGAGTAVYGATKAKPGTLKAIVLEGVHASSWDVGNTILVSRLGKWGGRFVADAIFEIGAQIWSMGKFRHSAPADEIVNLVDTPIMIIRGDNDDLVPRDSAERFIDAVPVLDELWVHSIGLEKDKFGHTKAYLTYPDEYTTRVLSFLNRHMDTHGTPTAH